MFGFVVSVIRFLTHVHPHLYNITDFVYITFSVRSSEALTTLQLSACKHLSNMKDTNIFTNTHVLQFMPIERCRAYHNWIDLIIILSYHVSKQFFVTLDL